jgi:hypothetical protein
LAVVNRRRFIKRFVLGSEGGRGKAGTHSCQTGAEVGYGARHDLLSQGVVDPLWAKTLVIEAGRATLPIVGMDLGRGPTTATMNRIRQAVAPAGIANVLVCGSHSHHGPVIELRDRPGFGKGKLDDVVA